MKVRLTNIKAAIEKIDRSLAGATPAARKLVKKELNDVFEAFRSADNAAQLPNDPSSPRPGCGDFVLDDAEQRFALDKLSPEALPLAEEVLKGAVVAEPPPPPQGRVRGSVAWFNAEKGFGFITPDDGGEKVFVHYSQIDTQGYKALDEGQHVEYEVVQGPKGPQAEKVRPV